jgi:hypothetical protein
MDLDVAPGKPTTQPEASSASNIADASAPCRWPLIID